MSTLHNIPTYLEKDAIIPKRAHPSDAGLDLFTPFMAMVPPNGRCVIDTGVHICIPEGYVGNLESKSGLMRKDGITCEGTIDAGYIGTIQAVLFNHTDKPKFFEPGDKITQLVIRPVETPTCMITSMSDLEIAATSNRGANGFGSSGR